jgi:hypothetical protein
MPPVRLIYCGKGGLGGKPTGACIEADDALRDDELIPERLIFSTRPKLGQFLTHDSRPRYAELRSAPNGLLLLAIVHRGPPASADGRGGSLRPRTVAREPGGAKHFGDRFIRVVKRIDEGCTYIAEFDPTCAR